MNSTEFFQEACCDVTSAPEIFLFILGYVEKLPSGADVYGLLNVSARPKSGEQFSDISVFVDIPDRRLISSLRAALEKSDGMNFISTPNLLVGEINGSERIRIQIDKGKLLLKVTP